MNSIKTDKSISMGRSAGKTQASQSDSFAVNVPEKTEAQRIKDLEQLNARLGSLLENGNTKINKVIATNSKYISIIAHDLRGPFIAILGILELIKENLKNDDTVEIEKYVGIAHASAKNALKLFDNLISWTIAQHKEEHFAPVKLNLFELVSEEFEYIKFSAVQKQITLTNNISRDMYIAADHEMVKTILRNLLGNAIKYTYPEGKVVVSARNIKLFVEISVKDNGIGISREVQKSLFNLDPIDSTAGTNNEKGTGLGLQLCSEFIEIHKGRIYVKSDPGKGSEFLFTLPHYL
jgi:signal transduction histidine kinase